ncbi:MAG TPA: PEP/pyruvate-binding domain-containing protein, partial [Prolixibacteraceae bacterium]|nr:PEP/pyruvate-binding domain-containing protein [Prolixibacteraceae bacterium]
MEQLRREVAGLPMLPYAVRSSAYGEDGSVHSCAGQFLTLLNRKGEEEIIGAILEVWRSATGFTTGEYSRMAGQQNGMPGCAVIIQEMVDSRFSGVSFSRNPVTGAPETIIEAVEGRGEELV